MQPSATRGKCRPIALACGLALAMAGCSDTPQGPPNVVLIVLDTLRPDHLGFHGYERETAPFLGSLAEHSAIFVNAVSTSSWTAPATASLFTSLYPTSHGVVRGFHALDTGYPDPLPSTLYLARLPEEVPTLVERFAQRGYRAFGVAANIDIGPELGFDRGFTRFTRLEGIVTHPTQAPKRYGSRRYASAPAQAVLDEVRGFEHELIGTAPWLLYLHLNDAHLPYHQRERWLVASRGNVFERAYDSEIGYADDALGRLSEYIASVTGTGERTLWVFLSDHGEAFGEHGFNGHERGLHGELNRILMMVHGPGIPRARIEQRVSILDVMPTLLDLAGLPVPGDVEGRSLAPLIRGDASAADALDRRTLFAHRLTARAEEAPTWAAMRGRYKLIDGPQGLELFDTDEDAREENDLAQELPEVRDGLVDELAEFRSRAKSAPNVEIPLEPAVVEALRSLGYGGERETKKE